MVVYQLMLDGSPDYERDPVLFTDQGLAVQHATNLLNEMAPNINIETKKWFDEILLKVKTTKGMTISFSIIPRDVHDSLASL